MASRRYVAFTIIAGLVTMTGAGCAGASDSTTSTSDAAPEQAAARPASGGGAVRLTEATLSAYERGMKREIEAVRAARERSSAARTSQERGEAIQASFEHATLPLGAEAAGLPVEQYRAVREAIGGIFRTLDFQGKIEGPLSMDLSRADAETKERLARDPFDDLSPESAAVLRAGMDRLVPVWIEYMTLTAVAG